MDTIVLDGVAGRDVPYESSEQRRRRSYTVEDKRRLVAESYEPGVDAFIALVEQGRFIEAIEGYYAPDATMQENQEPPRGGRDALISGERQVMAMFPTIETHKVQRSLIDGDLVVINWVFAFTSGNGQTMTLDEVAFQRWSGDQIVTEQFYYDPAQRRLA